MEDYSTFIIENYRNMTGISIFIAFILLGLSMLYIYNRHYDEISFNNKIIKRIFSIVCLTDFVATFVAIGILIMIISGSSFEFMVYIITLCVLSTIKLHFCD